MTEQSLQIFGVTISEQYLTQLDGNQNKSVSMVIKTVIMNQLQEEVEQEHREEKIVSTDLKYLKNYA